MEIIHRWLPPSVLRYRVSFSMHTRPRLTRARVCLYTRVCVCMHVSANKLADSRLRVDREGRDTHRPRYCCLPITSDNGSISGSGAEIVPPSVTVDGVTWPRSATSSREMQFRPPSRRKPEIERIYCVRSIHGRLIGPVLGNF